MRLNMKISHIYLYAKKIHRILVLVICVLTVLMATTGALLKYSFIASQFSFIDLRLTRWIHNQMSPFFSITLFGMILTGIIMYVFPLMKKK